MILIANMNNKDANSLACIRTCSKVGCLTPVALSVLCMVG